MTERDIDNVFILAIDHGTSGIKAAIASARGEIIDFDFEKTSVIYTDDGGVEQDPAEWWEALLRASRRLIDKGVVDADRIVAVCCSSTFSSTVVVDEAGDPLMNSLTWMDSRGATSVRRQMKGALNIQGYAARNAFLWIDRAGGAPAMSGKDDMGHMLYVRDRRPDIYKKSHMFLGSKDFLNARLTGKFAATFDSIALFWVADTRNINRVRYDGRLIRRLGIDGDKLPPLMASTEILGQILPMAAKKIGLREDVKVVAGSPDLQSACIGSGAVRDFEGHIYIGTSSWILCHVPFKKTDIFHIITSLPSSIPGRYFCANEQDTAGGCLSFMMDNLLFHKNELQEATPPCDMYERADRLAASAPAGSGGLIFTPWLNGEKTPVEDENLRGGFFNISSNLNTSHFVRAVMEGVAFNSRWILGHVEKFVGQKLDPLNIIGGGAQSETWCRIYADVLGREIRQVRDPIQANARGAAFIASAALGFISFSDIPRLIEFSNTFKPDMDNHRLYSRMFSEFINIYKNNRDMYRRINRK